MNPSHSSSKVKTIDRLLTILEAIRELDGARIAEISEELEMPESTIHAHLSTLHANEYVEKEGDIYHIGLRFLEMGEYARRRQASSALLSKAVPRIAEKTGEVAQYSVEEHGYGVFLYTAAGEQAVETPSQTGGRYFLNQLAAGKAILAGFPNEWVEEIIERHGLPPSTRHTITDPAVLFDDLEDIRERGYAINDGESMERFRGLGVAVHAPGNRVVGGLSIGGPASRLTMEELHGDLSELVVDFVNQIEVTVESSKKESFL